MRWTVIEHQGKAAREGPTVVLVPPGGTIGRSPDNHLVLPDAHRQISRLQATVRFDPAGTTVLRNMSAVLPIAVNDQMLQHNDERTVHEGDQIVIGSYVLLLGDVHADVDEDIDAETDAEADADAEVFDDVGQHVTRAPAGASSVPVAGPLTPQKHAVPVGVPLRSGDAPALASRAALSDSTSTVGTTQDVFTTGPSAGTPHQPPSAVSGADADVFADLFGEGALPLSDAGGSGVHRRSAASGVMDAAPATPASPSQPGGPTAFQPALAARQAAPTASKPAPGASSAKANSADAAIDWDAILANAPRRDTGAERDDAVLADPLAHEPFSLPSQSQRNPSDPLASLSPAGDDSIRPGRGALRQDSDPLSLFHGDDSAPHALSDPRPTVLREDHGLTSETHPAAELMGSTPLSTTVSSMSHSDRGSEMSSQFRPRPPAHKSGDADASTAPLQTLETRASARSAPLSVPASLASTDKPSDDEHSSPDAPSTRADHAAAGELAAMPDDAPQAEALPTAEITAPQAPAPAPAPAPTPEPTPPAAVSPEATVAPQPVRPAAAAPADDLLAAFFEGAGIQGLHAQQPLDIEGMRRIGRLMRAFTDGALELLSSRALLKREVRAEITMIVDEENNPFKILPNGRAVLMQMFGARMPGFIAPEAAVHDALADLHSHQLGMMAGMRAALLALLARFNPQALEKSTPHDGGVGEKWLPGGREARLWREMQQLHAQTTAAVQDDFQAIFGKAFQQAYDQEMERLREERRAG